MLPQSFRSGATHTEAQNTDRGTAGLAVLGKGKKLRLAPMPEALSHRFGDYCSWHNIAETQRLFPITRFRALQIVKECAARANIGRRVYTHLLRHGGALKSLEKTGNLKALQICLGHNDVKVTLRYLSTLQMVQALEIESKVTFDE